MNNQLTILICSCDYYSDTWLPFFTLFNKNWSDCDCRLILNTESKSFSLNSLNIETFNIYENWSPMYGERMIAHLKRITTPYTLILLDDFFIRKPVDSSMIDRLIKWMDQDSRIACFNFDCIEDSNNNRSEYPNFLLRPRIGEYKYNMQAGIWRTDYLLKSWKKKDSPWSWEVFGNTRSFDNKYKFYCLDSITKTPIDYGYNPQGFGVFRGKWVEKDVVDFFEKEGLSIDYSIRGFYNPNDEIAILGNNKIDKLEVAFNSINKKYFPIWVVFAAFNKIFKTHRIDYLSFLQKFTRKHFPTN